MDALTEKVRKLFYVIGNNYTARQYGALISLTAAVVCNTGRTSDQTANRVLRFSDVNPRFFYPALYTVTCQNSSLFDAARIIAGHLDNLPSGA
jgi:hypothetical protein